MLHKTIIGLAAVAAFGAAFVSTEASARGGHGGHGGGFHGGGFHGGGFRGGSFHGASFGRIHGGFRHHGFRGRFFAPGFAFYGAPYAYSYYDDDDFGCYRSVRVRTPYGLRWRQVYVCN